MAKTSTPTPTQTGPLTTGPNVRPGEKPPVLLPMAKVHDSGGALAFATYFVLAFDWSYATNDSYLLRHNSTPACSACIKAIAALDGLRPRGQTLTGSRIQIENAGVLPGSYTPHSDAVIGVTFSEGAAILHGPGAKSQQVEPTLRHHTSLFFLDWVSGRWAVVYLASKK